MCFKTTIIILILPLLSFSQIKIEDVGDKWKYKVEQAIDTIKKYDTEKYHFLIDNCNHIGYWNGNFSSTEDTSTILIANHEFALKSINNLAAILVHESVHLYIKRLGIKPSEKDEEKLCYWYEFDFLLHLPKVEPWLINHTKQHLTK